MGYSKKDTRKFDKGKDFNKWYKKYSTKVKAKKIAKEMQSYGWNVRTTKENKLYVLWTREGKYFKKKQRIGEMQLKKGK